VGLEREFEIKKAARAKNVAVVGAGPAGLESARILATRGHKVTLFERGPKIGGSLLIQAAPPCKDTILKLVNYFGTQLGKLAIKTELGTEATAKDLQKFDAVVLATGASRTSDAAAQNGSVVTAMAIFTGNAKLGKKVLVAGDDRVALEVADFISEKGIQTTVVSHEVPRAMAAGMLQSMKDQLFGRLAKKNVTLVSAVEFGAITSDGMNVCENYASSKPIAADTIVFTDAASADVNLLSALRKTVPEIFAVGDCLRKREHQDAIFDGSRVSRLLV
ncbi:MAG: FAD-dependent oxidoreductase, partial [Dehalococcoidia bacterium]